jgi:hypothetical protein
VVVSPGKVVSLGEVVSLVVVSLGSGSQEVV